MSRAVLALLLVSGLTFFAGLGRAAIGDSDEGFYAQAGREMHASGDWLTPHYNFEPRFQKPILFYWLIAGTFAVTGATPQAARFWAAGAGLGLVLVTFWVGRRWAGHQTGVLAGAMVATSFGCIGLARQALPDLPLAFFVTASIACAWMALFDETDAPTGRWAALAGAAAGLAMLTKGPVGPVVVALAVIGAAAVDWRRARLRMVDVAVAAAAFAVVAAPWYVAMWLQHGPAYLTGFFVGDNLERFATTRFNDPRPLWFYLPILAAGLLPWAPFFVLWLSPLRRPRSAWWALPVDRRLAMWVVLPLVFFSISVGKQPRYIMPLLPPLALLVARTLADRIERAARTGAHDWPLRACAAAGALVVGLFGVIVVRSSPLIIHLVAPSVIQRAALVMIAAGAVGIPLSLAGRLSRVPLTIAAIAAVAFAVQFGALAPGGTEPVERVAALVHEHREAGEAVGTFRVLVRNLVFYTGIRQTDLTHETDLDAFLGRDARVLCVLTATDRARAEARLGTRFVRLGRVRYFNTAIVKPRTLLFPDPGRDVAVVELIANR